MADDNELTSAGTPLVPRYVAGLVPTPQQGTYPTEFTRRPEPPLVVLVAWGADAQQAGIAQIDGYAHARTLGWQVHDSLASYGEVMSDAPLVAIALTSFERRDVRYGRAWWLVRHSAVSPLDMAQARARLRQAWALEAAKEQP